jgi:hypothetical protein
MLKIKMLHGTPKKDGKCVYRGHDTAKGGGWIVPLKAGFDLVDKTRYLLTEGLLG